MTDSIMARDRVLNSIEHKESDICPYYIWIHPEMVRPLADHYGDPDFQENYIKNHTVLWELLPKTTPLSADLFIDEYGCTWRQGPVMRVEQPGLNGPSLDGYKFPDLATPEHFEGLDQWLDRYSDRFRIVQLGMMFFERAWALRGFETLLIDLYDRPGFVDKMLDGLEQICHRVIDYLLENFGAKIDAIGLSDDYGGEISMLLSPKMWRRYILPHTERLFERIHHGGKFVYQHSCGHVDPVIPDLIQIGVDILQPIQPEAMDIMSLKRHYGKRICFAGGISTQKTLPFGSVRDVVEEVQICLSFMARGGGYIMAPAKPILPGVPLENAVALIDAFVNQHSQGLLP